MKTWKLLGASLTALALVACESGEDKAVRFAENAQDYLDEGQLQRAKLQFQNALQNDPNNVVALRGAAEVAERQERYGDQLRFLQRLVTLEPNNYEAIAKIARLNLLAGEPDDALERANQVLAAEPDNIEALTVKGAALVLQNNLDEASETLEKALAADPDNVEVRNLLAARYVRDEEFDRAQAIIDEGLAAEPDSEALLVVKLLLAQRRQDITAMDETFAALVEASPENGFYRQRYGEFLITARGDLDGARKQFEAAIPLLEDQTEAVGRLIGIIREQEDDATAEAELRELVAQYPDTDLVFAVPAFLCEIGEDERCLEELTRLANDDERPLEIRNQAKVDLGERAFARRDLDEASRYAEDVLETDPEDPKALTLKAKIQLAQGDVEPAIETLRTALNGDPNNEAALILLGLAYEENGRAPFAEAQLAQAIDRIGLSPNLFQAYRAMLLRNGKTDEASDLTLRFAQTPDATPQIQRESARVLVAQNRADEAEVVARSLLRADPDDVDARRILAASLMQQQRYEDALAELDRLPEDGQNDPQAIRIRAQALSQLRRTDELREFLQAQAARGEYPDSFVLLSQFETSQNNVDAAAEAARSGVDAFPEQEGLYVILYNALIAQGQEEAANQAILEGIEKAEDTTTLRLLRANQLLNENDRAAARDVLMTLYEDEQLGDLAANNLAALMLDLDDDPAQALEIAKRFEGTEQPFLADTLAWAYYRNGELEKALEYSEIAARTDTPNAEIFYHRGVIAAANGDTETARAAFEKALEAPGKTDVVSEEAIKAAIAEL
ncbi:tetratricopeptide repeat protein [Parvularcula lutaonensis]|uniref:Tetratricopeptide repeat protein n=1 Tax=Parvularcula lutaonensis TaxID=491923 RepID=A0ABV7MA99_9PROT|nr:tetratricopeptide repeat protein [Parvularcula lutaonensis]GGY46547.1 hypothetical protein GCM10007148_14570 [Parvularcula lutaonensis]